MKSFCAGTVLFGLLSMAAGGQAADRSLVDSVVNGCKKELETYCSDVTPGGGRVLACLYAYNNRLSGRCEYALYDAAVQLERAVAALGYVINECGDDIEKLCPSVEAGEGRIMACIDDNWSQVSARCTRAIGEVGSK